MADVFISYRQTNDDQRARVRAFAERLRDCDVSVVLDQFFKDRNPGGPDDGWDKWSSKGVLRSDYVLIIGTKEWFDCFEGNQPPGTGLGAACEADDVRHLIYKSGGVVKNIRVVLFDDADEAHLPAKLYRYHRFHAERDFADIVRWLGASVPMNSSAPPNPTIQGRTRQHASSTISDLVKDFYGNDPIIGENAANELLSVAGPGAIEALVPMESGLYRHIPQVTTRLKHVASDLGDQIVPYLVSVISSASWLSKMAAAACFSGLKRSTKTERALIEILQTSIDFDAKRMAIDSLGRLGADEWSYELERFARFGEWCFRGAHGSPPILKYPFAKLSSHTLQAFIRFAAQAADRDNADKMLRDLTSFIALMNTHERNRTPNGYMLVEWFKHEFTEWSVDPLIHRWGRSSDDKLQYLCATILGEIAPLRTAQFLLEITTSPSHSPLVRQSASKALSELRVLPAAQRVADSLRDPNVHGGYLDWAFSCLYAVPADWSGLSEYADELARRGDEQAAQLRYSAAFRGDYRFQKALVEQLDDPNPFTRWTSALALARLLGPKARVYLEHRVEDAGDATERCGMYAAIIRAGDHEKGYALHHALTEAPDVSSLPSIWKLEILDALRIVKIFDGRAFPLWLDAYRVGKRQLQFFDAMISASTGTQP